VNQKVDRGNRFPGENIAAYIPSQAAIAISTPGAEEIPYVEHTVLI